MDDQVHAIHEVVGLEKVAPFTLRVSLGYRHVQGQHLDRPLDEVVLRDRLRAFLAKRYPDLPAESVDEVVGRLARPEGADTLRRNRAFHAALARGLEVRVERPDGTVEYRHVHAVDWERPGRTNSWSSTSSPFTARTTAGPTSSSS